MVRAVVAGVGMSLFAMGCGPSRTAMSAGQIGCMESDIEISEDSSGFGSETWVATCNGARHVCSKVQTGQVYGSGTAYVGGTMHQVNCAPEGGHASAAKAAAPAPALASESAPVNKPEPPNGAAGFEFGKSVVEASAVCTEKDLSWEQVEPGRFGCSGTPQDIGLAGRSVLTFCKSQLCAIELVLQPTDSGKTFAGSFISLSEALDGKYGAPEKRETEMPGDCKDEKVLPDCFKQGRARFLRSWAWTSGERITMTLGGADAQREFALRIVYTRRPTGFRPKTDAL
jgi:hypothetical protein